MLNITLGNKEYFLVILSPNPFRLADPTTCLLIVLELQIVCFGLAYMPRLIHIFNSTSLFHKNFVLISQAILITYYPCVGARAVLFLYDVGVWTHKDSVPFSVVMVSLCFLRTWSMNVVLLYLPSVLVERTFASKYIVDYESTSRPWIHRAIIPLIFITAALMVLVDMLGFSNAVISTISSGIFVVIYSAAYIAVFHRDAVKLRDIYSGVCQKEVIYSLSAKFQLKENLRVMKILMQLSITWAVLGVFGCLSFILTASQFGNYSQWNQIGYALFNISFATAIDILVWTFTIAIGGLRLRLLLPWSTEIGIVNGIRPMEERRDASNAYFDHLTATWEK